MPITVQPNARVVQAIEKARTNDAKGVMSVKDAQTIAQTALIEEEGPPFVDEELIAPVRNALTFAFDLRKGPALETALADAFAMGVEQGKRIAKGDDRNALLLDFAVSSLESGDVRTAKSIADLL